MNYNVRLLPLALNDMQNIYNHIAVTLQEENTALKTLSKLEKKIAGISVMPEGFRRYETEPWKNRGLRVFPVDNFIIFYIPRSETQTVEVVRILYGGMNIESQLNKTPY